MKKVKYFVLAGLVPVMSLAQENAAAPANSSIDLVWWLIIGVMVLLLLAVFLLGNVSIKLTQMVMDKKSGKTVAMILLLIMSSAVFAQDPANAANFPAAATPNTSSTFSGSLNLILAGIVLTAELFAVLLLLLNIRSLLDQLSDKKEEKKSVKFQLPKLLENLNASVPLEREKDVLLDHNYDGIQELDNNLPPWWKYGFYLTIVYAIAYLSYYHVMGGQSQIEEYNSAMKVAEEQQAAIARLNKNKVDENNVALSDALGINEGKSIFEVNCATCHGKLGEGGAGPNLTDNYWVHGGTINDIYKSVKYGWSAKGMKAWEKDLGPVQMKDVASYILSLKGSNPPNAKAPEGELLQDGVTSTTSTDSSAVVTAAK